MAISKIVTNSVDSGVTLTSPTLASPTISAPVINSLSSAAATALTLQSAGVTAMTIDTSQNVLVGTTSLPIAGTRVGISGASTVGLGLLSYVNTGASTKKWSTGPDANGNFVVFNDASAGLYITYGGVAWTSSSDERLKTTIKPFENAIEKICSLRSGTGRYLADAESVSRSFLIAQDVQKILPEAVTVQENEQKTLGLAYTDLIPLLVAAIQEQQALILALTTRITALEAK